MEDTENERPEDDDVVIWHLPDRDGLDVYHVARGARVIGEFTGRSIGSAVFRAAIEQAEPGQTVWLKDELGFRRVFMPKQLTIRFTLPDDDDNVTLHKAQNFSEALMRALQRKGLGTTSDPDHVTDGLRIELASPRHLGAVRRLVQQMLKKHYLVEQSVISTS